MLSLHQSYTDNGFIAVSLSLQITHEVVFSQLNSFLVIFCNCQFRRLDSIQFIYSQAHILPGWRLGTRLNSSKSESESYITIDGQSTSLSWNKAPMWGLRPDFYYCQTVACMLIWGRSLTRGRVWRLRFLMAVASAVILGSQSLGTRDNVLLSQIRDFPYLRLLRLAGLRWKYSTPPPHGISILHNWTILFNYFARTGQKTQPLYCWEGVFTAPLYSKGSYSIVTCVFVGAGKCLPRRCLAMTVYSNFTIPPFGHHITLHYNFIITK
jgi:hypothetical protein